MLSMQEPIRHFAPIWLKKLPSHIQVCIIGFVVVHLLAILFLVFSHLTARKSPDFKAKIK